MSEKPTTVEEYMASLTPAAREVLTHIRDTVDSVVPDAEHGISYGIPVVKLDGKMMLYYAGWKAHVSVYPMPPGDAAFEERIAPYVAGRGTLKFMLSEPVPYDLVADVTRAHMKRLGEAQAQRAASKSKGRAVTRSKGSQ
jgi:uncharacterized protein YdhG (YjbR/CyaY superfamily)